MADTSCPFCAIIMGEGWAREVCRDDYAVAFSRFNRHLLATPWWFPVGTYPIFGRCRSKQLRTYLALSCGLPQRYVRLSPRMG